METNTPKSRTDRMSYAEKGRFFKLRNILNTVFILLALVGMGLYFVLPSDMVEAVCWPMLIAAVVIKMVECVLRYIK